MKKEKDISTSSPSLLEAASSDNNNNKSFTLSSSTPSTQPFSFSGLFNKKKSSQGSATSNKTSSPSPKGFRFSKLTSNKAPLSHSTPSQPICGDIDNVEKWEQDIVDKHRLSLDEAYIQIGCRQESYSRMKLWLNLDMKACKLQARKLLTVLAIVSEGFEVNESEYEILMNDFDIGQSCFKIAGKQTSLNHLRAWLRVGSQSPTRGGDKCMICEGALVLFNNGVSRLYRKGEVVLRLKRFHGKNITRDPVLHMFSNSIIIDDKAVHSFWVQTLLRGSLNKNETSSLYHSFFNSTLREVQLLPIIADYLVKKKKDKDIKYEKGRETETDSNPSSTLNVTGLASICVYFLSNDKEKEAVRHLVITNPLMLNFIDLFIPIFSSLSSLSLIPSINYRGSVHLDLSCLARVDTSKLTSIRIKNMFVSSLSPLSHCDLSRLERLEIKTSKIDGQQGITSLDGLTKNNTSTLRYLSISSSDLVDISSLKDCDLSSLEELNFNLCSSLSDISCFENMSLPSLKYFKATHTQISDTSVLSACKENLSLSSVEVDQRPIDEFSHLSHIYPIQVEEVDRFTYPSHSYIS